MSIRILRPELVVIVRKAVAIAAEVPEESVTEETTLGEVNMGGTVGSVELLPLREILQRETGLAIPPADIERLVGGRRHLSKLTVSRIVDYLNEKEPEREEAA